VPQQTPSERGISRWLRSYGVPGTVADVGGAAAALTPWGGAYDIGREWIGPGLREGNPWQIGAGTALAIFGGVGARTANRPMLARAQEMARAGRTRDDIWNETGWFRGRDGNWRFEIDDSRMSVGSGNQIGVRGEFLSHPGLAAAYPALDDLTVSVNRGRPGDMMSFYKPMSSPGGPEARVRGYPEHLQGGAVHELQHAVDDLENRLGTGAPYASPAEAYRSIEEVMARNAQYRARLNPQERRASPPWTTQGIPDEQQIVRMR
jgi:hypothetical protein